MGKRFIEQPRCVRCGVFVGWDADNSTPFGCADPENPEPPDPEYLCRKHEQDEYKILLRRYKEGYRGGDWQKSRAETKAAKRAGLEWVHSDGFVDLRTELDVHYQYILTSEKAFYEPSLVWHANHPQHDFWLPESPNCRRCGADWKTAHTRGTEYCHQVTNVAGLDAAPFTNLSNPAEESNP